MEIRLLNYNSDAVDKYVNHHPDGKLEYTYSWSECMSNQFGYKCYYFVAYNKDNVCGVMPVVHVNSMLFGNRMISQVFSAYGGALADDNQISKLLIDKSVEVAKEIDCDWIEYRSPTIFDETFTIKDDKVCMYFYIQGSPDHIWMQFNKRIRTSVRKAEKEGVTVKIGGDEYLDEFYSIWSQRMKEFGTPCYPKTLFQMIIKRYPNNVKLLIAQKDGIVISAKYTYSTTNFAQSRWAATLSGYNYCNPNYLLNWELIKYYSERNVKVLDFGTSTLESNQYEFKQKWGCVPVNLYYQFWVKPSYVLNIPKPNNPKYKRKIKLWKKLPLWLTRIIGPMISKQLP